MRGTTRQRYFVQLADADVEKPARTARPENGTLSYRTVFPRLCAAFPVGRRAPVLERWRHREAEWE